MKCPNHKLDAPRLVFSEITLPNKRGPTTKKTAKNKRLAVATCFECFTIFTKPMKVVELPTDR